MKYTTKRNVQFSIFSIAVVIAFTGCSTNNNAFPSSGTYDADTFRAKYDPDPNVDYSTIKRKTYKKLNLASGTYDAATFRAKYDPDPNVTYTQPTSSAYVTANSRSSDVNSDNTRMLAMFVGIMGEYFLHQSNMKHINAKNSVNPNSTSININPSSRWQHNMKHKAIFNY